MDNGDKTNKELLREVLVKVDRSISITTELNKSHKDLKISYYELKETVTEIDHTIRGTKIERESGKGGMAKQVDQNTICISQIKRKQSKIVAWGSMIVMVLNVAVFGLINFFMRKQ